MTWNEYVQTFDAILNTPQPNAPYDDAHYMEYTKLNKSRMNRWLKTGQLSEEVVNELNAITEAQHWVLITEPWCGDAAHCNPFIYKMSEVNALVNLSIQLRDTDSEIDQYLTNGSKSVPKLIVRNAEGKDIFVWGPRPIAAQEYFMTQKALGLDLEDQKSKLQEWYNNDKGGEIQKEFASWLSKVTRQEMA
ncbi:MAG: thioredoxin family protein [Crocinitomicaceae bacterium]|nr:MAG: thioredoxin family protein [Crocinitomicaceae bacterium]